MKELTSALLKAQIEIKNASKDAKNSHFKNSYATLESVIDAVKEIANKHSIAIVQLGGRDDRGDYVETLLMHTSGESLNSRCYLVLKQNDMQGLGSAITYARRYSLASIFCITQEDDDGNGASRPQSSAPKNEVQRKVGGPGDYIAPIGKHKGKSLSEIGTKELLDYCKYITTTNTELTGPMKEFVDRSREFLKGAQA
jgi:hypothetical protein